MATIPTPVIGVPYSFQLTSAGGVPPIVWTLSSGSLPDNLVLHSNGLIDGIPVEAGTFTPTFKATDALGNVVYMSCTLTMTAPCNLASTIITVNPGATPVDVLLADAFMYVSYSDGSQIIIEKRSQTTAALIATLNIGPFLDIISGGAMAADDNNIYVASYDFENATNRQYLSILKVSKASFTVVDSLGLIDEMGGLPGDYSFDRMLVKNGYVYGSGYRRAGAPRFADGWISQTLLSTFSSASVRDFAQYKEIGNQGAWQADDNYLFIHTAAAASSTDNKLFRFDLSNINNPESSVDLTTLNSYYGQQIAMDDDFVYPIRSGATTNYIAKVAKDPLVVTQIPTLLGAGSGARCWGASYKDGYIYIYGSRTTSENQEMLTRIPAEDLADFDVYYCFGSEPLTQMYGTFYAPFITSSDVFIVFGSSIAVFFLPGFYPQ